MSVRQRRDGAGGDSAKKKKGFGLFGARKKELHIDKKSLDEIPKDTSENLPADEELPSGQIIAEKVSIPVTLTEKPMPEAQPLVKRITNPLIDDDEDVDFLDDPDSEEEIDFLDEEDDEEEDGVKADVGKAGNTKADDGNADPDKDKPDKKAKRRSADDDDDDDDFEDDDEDDDGIDVNQLLAEKEAYIAKKREKRELRKQKVRNFFTKVKNTSPKDIWAKRGDAKDYLLGKFDQVKGKLKGKEQSESTEEAAEAEKLREAAKLKISQNKDRIRIAAIGTLAVLLFVGLGIYFRVRVFHEMKVITVQERQDDNATEYVPLKRYRLKCSPNGVTCVNKKNEVIWNTTFTMQRPLVDQCGDLVAVGSQRGNEIYIFNADGLVSSFTVEHVLTKMKITKQGDVAVILEDGQLTWINVYDKWGKILIRNRTSMPESGYPLDMDISNNGYKMMVSFLGVDDDIESRVAFYNFTAVGQDSEGRLVNQEVYTGHVVPEVKFMEGNYALAFMDNGVTVFRGQQIPEQCNEIMIDQEIFSEFSNEDYFGFVTESDEENREHKYKIVIYRENGSKCGTIFTNFEYTNIVMNDKQVILYNNTSMQIYNVTGRLIFSGDYNKQILKVVPTSSSRKFNILTDDSVDLIKIK